MPSSATPFVVDLEQVSLADLPLATLLAEVERDLIGSDGT